MNPSTDPLVRLAQSTIESFIRTRAIPAAPGLPPDLPPRAGCFVSIHTGSGAELRGCIGTIGPTQPTLAAEVIHNAISAATQDPRFPAIRPGELDGLDISVDVLFEPEPAQREDLDPKLFGVIVTQGFRRGLLLPDLDGVDTADEQLRIACLKAEIDPATNYEIERFRVVRHA